MTSENGTNSTLRALIDLRDRTLQKSRIQFGNRLSAFERGADQANESTSELVTRWQQRFNELELEADKDIEALIGDWPIVQAMIQIRGVGKLLAAKVIAMIDIDRADTVSALWRYAGYGVVDGERERPVKGEKLHYNIRLKTTCYLIGTSFLRLKSPYADVYYAAKEYYQANRADWTKLHIHRAAMRKMIKVWLSHLWQVWREMEGLPTPDLYVMEKMGHTHYKSPSEFGWIEALGKSEPSPESEPYPTSEPNRLSEPGSISEPITQSEPG